MPESVTNELLLELSKAMHTRFDRIEALLDTVAADTRGLNEQNAASVPMTRGMMPSPATQDDRFDALRRRVERIERRLGLTGEP